MERKLVHEVIAEVIRSCPEATVKILGLSGKIHVKVECSVGNARRTFTLPHTAKTTRRRVLNYARMIRARMKGEA